MAMLMAWGVLHAVPARATECRAIAGGTPELAAISAETRLAWIDRRLADDAARANIWSYTWQSAFAAAAIIQFGLIPTVNSTPERAEKIVGGTLASIGVIAGVALPLKVRGDQRWWARHYRLHASDHPCALLHTAEQLLIRDAESEAFGVSPLVHIGNFVLNVAGGLLLGLGYGRWQAFAYSSVVGIVVGEIQVSTQPTDAVEDLRLYRAAQLESAHRPRLGLALAPLLRPDGGGAAITLRF